MIYELRIYKIAAGKAKELHDRFINSTFDLFKRHGIKVCDFWVNLEGDKIYYICEFENTQKKDESWGKFRNDKDWIDVKSESEINGPLTENIQSITLKRADYFKPDCK
jgi:L-rhamnose mutarotase